MQKSIHYENVVGASASEIIDSVRHQPAYALVRKACAAVCNSLSGAIDSINYRARTCERRGVFSLAATEIENSEALARGMFCEE